MLTDGKHMISHGIFGAYFNITITKNERIITLTARTTRFWNCLQKVTYSYLQRDSSALQNFSTYAYIGNLLIVLSRQTNIFKNLSAFGKARVNSIFSCEIHILCLSALLWMSILCFVLSDLLWNAGMKWNYSLGNTAHQPVLPVQLFLVGKRVHTWGSNASKAHFISLMLKLCAVAN